MSRAIRLLLVLFVVSLFGAIGIPGTPTLSNINQVIGPVSSSAQQVRSKKRKSLFKILFGRKKAKKKAVVKRRRVKSRRAKKKSLRSRNKRSARRRAKTKGSKRSAGGLKKPVPVIVEKLEESKVVLVVGDFFAGGLADGLEKAFAEVAGLRVVDKSNGLSGFVRNDIVDWPVTLPALVAEIKPAYVVAMVGSNDRQLMRENGQKLKKRTPEWDAAYIQRVNALGASLKATNVPFIWVGLPPVRFKKMNTDFLYFNELYGKAAASPQGRFVDVWDGYSDADGNYSRSGPDVDGQIVLLRPKDGINLTKAGRRRLAFYVEGTILKALTGGFGGGDPGLVFDFETVTPKTAEYDPARTGKTVVIRLDDPSADGAETLAGEKINLNGGLSSSFAVPVLNAPSPVVRREGRVDNYVWPPVSPGGLGTIPALAAADNQN